MAKTKDALTDNQIVSICRSEIDSASGYASSELSRERSEAMDYYLGEPYGDEVEGRSSVRTREVLETVEWVLPSLLRIFTDAENCVAFDPVGPEDVEQAKTETDTVSHVFFKQNRGFYNLYNLCKDALLSKTGILKIWWDDTPEVEREEYTGLDDMQLGELMADGSVEREIQEYEQTEDGHHVVFLTTRSRGKICCEPVPPEEFGISRDARSPYVEDATFAYHRSRKSFSDLVEMGYDPALIRTLPANDDVETEEQLARRNLSDEEESLDWSHEESMRMFWITECYVRADRDGDDIAELLKVTLAAGSYTASGARLLGIEEVDDMPFATCSPILLTHKFYGLSLADLTQDLQRIKSAMLRQMLDNTYLSNNARVAVNDRLVNLDDLQTSRPGGIVRYKGDQPANAYIQPIPHTPLPPQAFTMMEYLDDIRKQRTGVGDEVAGLDKNSLASVSPSVAALAFDAARMKIELIARIIAEIALKPAFRRVHELMMKNQDREMMLQLNARWVAVNPGEWRTRVNSTVQVGTGSASRERKLMSLETVMQQQMEQVAQGGLGSVVMPEQIYRARADWAAASGLKPDLYWMDPAMVPPKPPQPDAQQDALMMQAQAMMIEAQTKQERNQLDMAKAQADTQLRMREQDLKQQEQELRAELESMKAHMVAMKQEADSDTKVASLELQMDRQDTEQEIRKLEVSLKQIEAERDREVELYKIQVDNLTKLMQSHGIASDPQAEEMKQLAQQQRDEESRVTVEYLAQLMASNQALTERIDELQSRADRPRVVKRDAAGMMVSIDDAPVTRDAAGRITQIG